MTENYMKQYIGLLKEYKKNNKSQEIIEKIHDLINILEKDGNKDNKTVLVCVYKLLAYHKKAYDLYSKIYNENDRKQKAKLFVMEQMSKSHGDNFAVKLKKRPEINKTVNYGVNDFIEEDIIGEYKYYMLNQTCIIFGQMFDSEPLRIELYKKFLLSDYIIQINGYIHWLGEGCKRKLIDCFNRNMTFVEEKADDEWYETLEIYGVSITIPKTEKLCAIVTCGDNIVRDHILDIGTEDDKICTMNIDG
jgi:hypothetical protein